MRGGHGACHLREARVLVLEPVRLIHHEEGPRDLAQSSRLEGEHLIRRHADVEGARAQLVLHSVLARLPVAVQLDHLERGAPLGELALPVAQHRERHDDQVRLPVEQVERGHAEH